MDKDCATHEAIIVDRLTKIIEDKVELSVTMKISALNKWVVGTVLAITAMFLTVILSNSYYIGKQEALNDSIVKYMENQDKINYSIKEQLDETVSSQMVVLANMKRLDPNFMLPSQLRGGEDIGN